MIPPSRFWVLPAWAAGVWLQVCVLAGAAPTNAPSSLFTDPVIATGTGFEIKRSQLDEAVANFSAEVARKGRTVNDADRPSIRSNLLQHLITDKILLQKATADDKTKVGHDIDAFIDKVRTNAYSPEDFTAQIKATGLSLAQWRDQAIEDELCRRILLRETTNGIVIPDADVKKFYDDNPSKFLRPERVRLSHILVLTWDFDNNRPLPPETKKEKLNLAEDLRARAEKGEDFAALAKKYSDDRASKERGGEDILSKGQRLPPLYASVVTGPSGLALQANEFEAAAFTLKVGQVSDIVETKYAYHIIKLLEKIPASKEDFDKAAPDIRDWLTEQKAEQTLPAYLAKLKEGASVKILDPTAR
jgi:peptidyl-prolyl cis-trans isomerase C